MTTSEHIKEKLIKFDPKSKKINLFHPNIQRTSNRYFILKMSDGSIFKLFDFSDKILIETRIKASILFAINLPDKICLADKPLKNNFGIDIYTTHSKDNTIINCINLIQKEIRDLHLKNNEGIYIYNNSIEFNLNNNRDLITEIFILQKLKSIIEENFPEISDIIDINNLPSNLKDLVPLFSEWAILDDREREEKIYKSPKQSLKKIVDMVSPKMDDINKYLDSFKSEPIPREAILIGSIAELVSEIME